MTAAALAAGIVASTEELARLMGAGRFEALVHNGQRQSCLLAAFGTPRGRWIGLVVFGPETSIGLVRLFFEQMVQQLAAAAPREQAPPGPMLAENFETELNASLKALFGR
jgi:predicted regulator of Ras-like GTPase activity (Roadblock/LC7/MglB family)